MATDTTYKTSLYVQEGQSVYHLKESGLIVNKV